MLVPLAVAPAVASRPLEAGHRRLDVSSGFLKSNQLAEKSSRRELEARNQSTGWKDSSFCFKTTVCNSDLFFFNKNKTGKSKLF